MAETYYYIIRVGDVDISRFVTALAYEDCLQEDDQLHLSFDAIPSWLLESDAFKAGKDIEFQYGYNGGVSSPLRVMRISDIDVDYGKTVKGSLKAFDYGQLLKKQVSTKVWVNRTTSDIAREIAEKYELGTGYIERTNIRHTHMPQGTRTDWELLNYLVEREEAGSWHWYIKGDDLRLEKIDLDQTPAGEFTYGVDVISFKPSLKDAQNKDNKNTNKLLDPLTQKTSHVQVDTSNAQEQTLMGRYNNSTSEKRSSNNDTTPMYDENGLPIKSS